MGSSYRLVEINYGIINGPIITMVMVGYHDPFDQIFDDHQLAQFQHFRFLFLV